MLYTNLTHIENTTQHTQYINKYEHVVIVCGSMDPDSITLYRIVEKLKTHFKHVRFFDLELGNPKVDFNLIFEDKSRPTNETGLLYYKNGKLVEWNFEPQTRTQIKSVLNKTFTVTENA